MENSVSKANEKAQQFSGYLELKEYQRQTIEAYLSGQRCVRFELRMLSSTCRKKTSRWFSSSFRWSRLWKTKLAIWSDQVSSLVNLVPILGLTASQSEVTNMKYDARAIR